MSKENSYAYITVNKDVYGIRITEIGEKLRIIKINEDNSIVVITKHGFYLNMKPGEYALDSDDNPAQNIKYEAKIRELADQLYTAAFHSDESDSDHIPVEYNIILVRGDNHLLVSINSITNIITIRPIGGD